MAANAGKKFLNAVENCVDENLLGVVAANNLLKLIPEHRVVVRADYERVKADGKVTILSGGGSGHEPFAAGFVGKGMLTAAVAGSVFVSPPTTHILAALKLLGVGNKAGTLMIVANYTGDRLNFGLAAEQAKAEGHHVEISIVHDDCALVSADKSAGRRGLCGIVVTMKIAGAMAERGHSLQEIVATLKQVSENLGSIGLSLTPCSIPGFGANFSLGEDEVELGLGVHGEAGVERMKLKPAKDLVNTMFNHMTDPKSASCLQLTAGDQVVLLINNLGGTSNLEMNIVTWEAISWLESRNVKVARVFCAPVMTSLEMAGITINVLKATDQMIAYIDDEVLAPGWPKSLQTTPDWSQHLNRSSSSSCLLPITETVTDSTTKDDLSAVHLNEDNVALFKAAITVACHSIIKAKDLLNSLDSSCGDGDCGSTLSQGSQAILDALNKGQVQLKCPFKAMQQLSNVCQQSMGGCSGALYGIFFAAIGPSLKNHFSVRSWCEAIHLGIRAITKYGGAERGDRTMLDALYKVTDALQLFEDDWQSAIAAAADGAEEGAKATAGMKARAGRASYVSSEQWSRCDPGAEAVAIALRPIADMLRNQPKAKS